MPESLLIVDDDTSTVHMLTSFLAEQGYSVRSTKSGEAALSEMGREPVDLILLSTHLPDITGYELAEELRETSDSGEAGSVPIIFVSDLEAATDKVKAFDSGRVDFITKPLQMAEVLARVNTHLTTRRLTRELNRTRSDLERAGEERSGELNRQLQLFRKFVPQTFARALDESGFDVTSGVSREEFYSVLYQKLHRLLRVDYLY